MVWYAIFLYVRKVDWISTGHTCAFSGILFLHGDTPIGKPLDMQQNVWQARRKGRVYATDVTS